MSDTEIYSPGLEGVIAGETAISTVEGGLRYRGYPSAELAGQYQLRRGGILCCCTASCRTAPNSPDSSSAWRRPAVCRSRCSTCCASAAAAQPMDVVRTSVSILAHYDPETDNGSREANLRKAERLSGANPRGHGRPLSPEPGDGSRARARADLGHAANFLWMLRGQRRGLDEVRALDVSLILYAEHEFNASTFTARVVCSTQSDLHSAITAAIGALKGRLHGGANEKVMDCPGGRGRPRPGRGVAAPGPGSQGADHGLRPSRLQGGGRPRRHPQAVRPEGVGGGRAPNFEETAEIIEHILAAEKHLYPNLDWPSARLYHALGLAVPLYTPIFVMARVTGWSAHFIEQHENNRLIRPRSRYVGPEVRRVLPLTQRG